MSKVGSWWLAKHAALEDEQALWSCLANRTQSSNRAIGGKLFVTNKRLLFSPHLIDYATGGKKMAVAREQITQIDKQPKGGDSLGGGLRDRLRVSLADGNVQLFVVNGLDAVIAVLRAELQLGP